MIRRYGNIWEAHRGKDIILVTTNNVVTRNKLVMGSGIALEAKKRFPGIDTRFAVESHGRSEYNLIILDDIRVGAFQSKYHFRDNSSLQLIGNSAHALLLYAQKRPDTTIHLPFPGIGYGGLKPESVLPLLLSLPDNVHVWSFK